MKFNHHIKFIADKVSMSIGSLYKLQSYLSFSCSKQLYFSLNYPYLNYCLIAWGGACFIHLDPLVILHKKAVRIITKSNYLAQRAHLFHRCGFLNLRYIYKFIFLAYFYKNLPEHNFTRSQSYNTSRAPELCPIYQSLHLTQKSKNYLGPMVCIEVPTEIKSVNTLKNSKT